MSEERLQEIKDSVEFQKEILEAHNMNTLCVDEEQELVEEVERLHSIIKEAREYIEEKYDYILGDDTFLDHDERVDSRQIKHILEILEKESK